MVDVMVELQRRRTASRVFHGKHGFITPRDLFRWAGRKPASHQELAEAGYALLAERLRVPAECEIVLEVISKAMPNTSLSPPALYERLLANAPGGRGAAADTGGAPSAAGDAHSTVWMPSTRRLYALLAACMEHNEAVLLVGETGTGKTTVCQLFAEAASQRLHIINCHQNTETADFVGGLRPTRGRALLLRELERRVRSLEARLPAARAGEAPKADGADGRVGADDLVDGASADEVSPMVVDQADGESETTAEAIESRLDSVHSELTAIKESLPHGAEEAEALDGGESEALDGLLAEADSVSAGIVRSRALFAWSDGPLLTAMRNGDLLLIDEISLAEDAVLERLNSVLDPSRTLCVPEKGDTLEEVRPPP